MTKRKNRGYASLGGAELLELERKRSVLNLVDNYMMSDKNAKLKSFDTNFVNEVGLMLYPDIEEVVETKVLGSSITNLNYFNYKTQKVLELYKNDNFYTVYNYISDNLIGNIYDDFDVECHSKARNLFILYLLYRDVDLSDTAKLREDAQRVIDIVLSSVYAKFNFRFYNQKFKKETDKNVYKDWLGYRPMNNKSYKTIKTNAFKDIAGVKDPCSFVEFLNSYYKIYADKLDEGVEYKKIDFEGVLNHDKYELILDLANSYFNGTQSYSKARELLSDEQLEVYKRFELLYYERYYYIAGRHKNNMILKCLEDLREDEDSKKENFTKELVNKEKQLVSDIKKLNKENNRLEKDLKQELEKTKNLEENLKKLNGNVCSLSDLDKKKGELDKLKQIEKTLKEDNQSLVNKNHSLTSRVLELELRLEKLNSLERKLEKLTKENSELCKKVDMLNHCIEVSNQEDDGERQLKVDRLKNLKIQFFGANVDLGIRLKELLPNLEHTPISEKSQSFIVSNTADCFVYITKKVRHSWVRRIESHANGRPVVPINVMNVDLFIDEVYRVLYPESVVNE